MLVVQKNTTNMEARDARLNIEVVEAKDLISKQGNVRIDSFCVIYLKSSSMQREKTDTRRATCTPIWREFFEFPIHESGNEVLCVEVYEKAGKSVSFRQLGKLMGATNCRTQGIELLGGFQIPVKKLLTTEIAQWLPLKRKNKRKNCGFIKLRLALSNEQETRTAIEEHRRLLNKLLSAELENKEIEKYRWCNDWSEGVEETLNQDLIQHKLFRRHQYYSQWVEYVQIHQHHSLSYVIFQTIILELIEYMKNKMFTVQETETFWESTKIILQSCFETLRTIRTLLPEIEDCKIQVSAILEIVSAISHLHAPFQDLDLMKDLKNAVIQGTEDHLVHLTNIISTESAMEHHIKLLELIKDDIQEAGRNYDGIFMENMNLHYSQTTYIIYEKKISKFLGIAVEVFCNKLKEKNKDESVGKNLFQLFVCLQGFVELGQGICNETQFNQMHIRNYNNWFKDGITFLLGVTLIQSIERIEKAIELDEWQRIHDNIRCTSSAADTLDIFHGIENDWKKFTANDIKMSCTSLSMIFHAVCRSTLLYADKIIKKAEKSSEQNVNGFFVSKYWCIAINNIDHIRSSFEKLAKDFGFDEIIETVGSMEIEEERISCYQNLQKARDNADDVIQNRITQLMQAVGHNMAPTISRYLSEVATQKIVTDNPMNCLFDYVGTNMNTLHGNLNDALFQKARLQIWETISDTLETLAHKSLEKGTSPLYYCNLHKVLNDLVTFFAFGPNEASNFQELKLFLKIHGLETSILINKYYQKCVEEQKKLKDQPIYGEITIKAQFVGNLLNIRILNAKNLQPLDNNESGLTLKRKMDKDKKGKCDSYVKLKFSPEYKFVGLKPLRTAIQKDNLFPLYDTDFSINLSQIQKSMDGAMLVFNVKDKFYLQSRIMGKAFLPFSEIPETESDQGIDTLPQVILPLSRPIDRDSTIYRALEMRKDDKQAVDFIRQIRGSVENK